MTLKEECAQAESNIIDLSAAFGILKVFRENFDSQSGAVQAEVLREVVKRIVIYSDRVVAEFYGSKPMRVDFNDGFLQSKNNKPVTDVRRSRVRTVFNLVDPTGVEPATP